MAAALGPVVALDAGISDDGIPAVLSSELRDGGALSGERLVRLLRDEGVDRIIHLDCALDWPRRPPYRGLDALNLLAAAAAAQVSHVVLRSSTMLYGARAENTDQLKEDTPLRPEMRLAGVSAALEAEHHAESFSRRYPGMSIGVLRLAPVLETRGESPLVALLRTRFVPAVWDSDPLVQLLHPDDALEALICGLARRVSGALNITPKSSMPWRAALQVAKKRIVSLPAPLAGVLEQLVWAVGRGALASALAYTRYSCVADGARARQSVAFEARYRSRDALAEWLDQGPG